MAHDTKSAHLPTVSAQYTTPAIRHRFRSQAVDAVRTIWQVISKVISKPVSHRSDRCDFEFYVEFECGRFELEWGCGLGWIELDAMVAFTVTLASGRWVRLPNAHRLSIYTVPLYMDTERCNACVPAVPQRACIAVTAQRELIFNPFGLVPV